VPSEFITTKGPEGLTLFIEFIPNKAKPEQIYMVFNDQRVAERRDGKWQSLVQWFHIEDTGKGFKVEVMPQIIELEDGTDKRLIQ
jgi:hypothetical protein